MTVPQGIHKIHSRLPSISHNHWGVFFFGSPNNDDPVQAFSCTAEKGRMEKGEVAGVEEVGRWGGEEREKETSNARDTRFL